MWFKKYGCLCAQRMSKLFSSDEYFFLLFPLNISDSFIPTYDWSSYDCTVVLVPNTQISPKVWAHHLKCRRTSILHIKFQSSLSKSLLITWTPFFAFLLFISQCGLLSHHFLSFTTARPGEDHLYPLSWQLFHPLCFFYAAVLSICTVTCTPTATTSNTQNNYLAALILFLENSQA